MRLGDLSHLSAEDAALYAALYAERNLVDRHELDVVRQASALEVDHHNRHRPARQRAA